MLDHLLLIDKVELSLFSIKKVPTSMKDSTSTNFQGKPIGSPKPYQVTHSKPYDTTASKESTKTQGFDA